MLIQKISPAQKNIIILSSAVVLIFFIFWLFIYLPNKNIAMRIKSELAEFENQIKEIESSISQDMPAGESVRHLKDRFEDLNNIFPKKEEDGLRLITDSARKHNIEVISIKPQAKMIFLDRDNQKIEIQGKICQCVSVSVQMRCSYEDLVEYIADLNDSLSVFVTVERLKINKDNSGAAKLDTNLDLNLYLLS